MKNNRSKLQSTIVDELRTILDSYNPFVKMYRYVRDRVTSDGVQNLKLRILSNRNQDARRYNLPTTSEVAALIVGDFDSGHHDRDIIVEEKCGFLQRIPTLSASYLPLQYPLLFPRGEDGWWNKIEYNDATSSKTIRRKFVTLREWFAFRIQQRSNEPSVILYGRRLFQQFLVDGYSMVESQRLQWVKHHQLELRAELYKGLSDAVLQGDLNPTTVGRRIVLPSSFTGGARYMQQNYQDAMAICRWAGYPDLFITFTCNPKWPELTQLLESICLQSPDRPDLVARIFKIKLDELIRDIKVGSIFGRTKAGIVYF